MKGNLVQIEKYGRKVWTSSDGCAIAKEGLRLCQLTDIAFMTTRCPKFYPKD